MTDDTRKLIELARTREKEWASRESLPSDVLLIVELADALEASLPTEDDREALIESLAVAMLGTEDGDLIENESEIPAGEMFRLAADWVRANASAFRRSPVPPETDEEN